MNTVKINRTDLLERVRGNAATHEAQVRAAFEGYRRAATTELEGMLAAAREGKPIVRALTCPVPEDHRKEYDRVVAMLEMDVRTEIELSVTEFDQYVLDSWSWSQRALLTNAAYLPARD